MKYFWSFVLLVFFVSSSSAQLIINEICYDPSNSALEGDANGDGVYDQTQDEFIEFVNKGSGPLDISKFKIYDRVLATGLKTLRHTVANHIILPGGGAYVVFGGGTAVGTFGSAYVEVDLGTQGLSLGNTGESVIIEDSMGVFIDSINTDALSNNPDESYTRNPDFIGDFVQHNTAAQGVLFSPGIRVESGFFTPYTSRNPELSVDQVVVYPNPGKGLFHIAGYQQEGEVAYLMNVAGQQVLTTPVFNQKVDLGSLAPGLYRLRLGKTGVQHTVVVLP